MSTELAATSVRMTYDQFREYAKSGPLRTGGKFRIVEPTHVPAIYWGRRMQGYCETVEEAGIYTVEQVLELGYCPQVFIEFADEPSFTTPPTPRILITINQAKTYRDQIQNKMCRWEVKGLPGYWAKRPLGVGYTTKVDEAQEFQIKTILDAYHTSHSSILIDMLDQEEAERISKLPVKLCILEDSLPDSMIQSLKAQPTNPVYRGLILAKCGKMPPDEIVEFDKLKDWIEYNCEPKAIVTPAARPAPAPQPDAAPRFIVGLLYSETEVGRCNYSIQRRGSRDYMFTANDLRDMVETCDNLDDLIEEIECDINVGAYDDPPEMDSGDNDYDYDRHEATDTEDAEWEYQDIPTRRRENLVRFLRTILSPAELERLGIWTTATPPAP